MNPTLLIIDDEPSIRQSICYVFKNKGYDVYEAATAGEGVRLAGDVQPDVMILDYRLPDMTGIEALASLRYALPESLVIMLTAFGSIPDAVEAMRKGAFDYLTKPVDMDVLEAAVNRACEVMGLRKENFFLKQRQEGVGGRLLGQSKEMHKLLLMVDMLAENPNTTVLIGGESGTGKELVAKRIHMLSSRKDRPFVDINCASLSEHLLESELFGHEKGAFTDAKGMKRGLLEEANGGTVFLDEIGELSQTLQPKLLRVLETKTFRRVGGTKDIRVDVRIMAATNRNLWEAVSRKEFREDLYYRLSVMPILLPSLRERGGDVLVLARYFLGQMSMGLKKKIENLSPECERYLMDYAWPGNVRELKNVIERAVILSPGPLVAPEHLPLELTGGPAARVDAADAPLSLDEMERRHVQNIMAMEAGNHSHTARILGISRSTLLKKLKKYSLV